jgi:hypothetical protein
MDGLFASFFSCIVEKNNRKYELNTISSIGNLTCKIMNRFKNTKM